MEKRIIVIEDDQDLSNLVALHLREANYKVTVTGNGEEGLRRCMSEDYHLAILDVNLPGIDGLQVCRQLRQSKRQLPVLMLTSKSGEIDKVLGLELGADDYVTKPFSVRELMARVAAILRRSTGTNESPPDSTLKAAGLAIDLLRRKVDLDGQTIELTPTEFDLLVFLAKNPGRAFSRDELLSSVWGYQFSGYEHTVNSHINRLRSKIEKDPAKPRFILTIWGVGYRFAEKHELEAEPAQ